MFKITKVFIITIISVALMGFGVVYAAKPIIKDAPSQAIDIVIKNPLGVNTINEAIAKIMNVIVKLAIPVIICLFIWTGFQFILAQGSDKKLKDAKAMFGNVIIGSVLVLGAWAIATAIVNTVNLITTGTAN